jgi:hypothetical protein
MIDDREMGAGVGDLGDVTETGPVTATGAQPGKELVPQKAQLVAGEGGYIRPTTIEEAYRMAVAIVGGNLAPSSYDNDPKKVMLGLMAAMEAGLPPMYGLRQIAIINGRPSIWGDGAMALIQNSGNLANQQIVWDIPDGFDPNTIELNRWPDEYGVTVKLWRKGQDDPYIGAFCVGDAKRARLWMNAKKVPWMEHPRRMLMIRARAFAQRDGFADALAGLSIREEVEDYAGNEDKAVSAEFLSPEPQVEAPPLPENEEEAS